MIENFPYDSSLREASKNLELIGDLVVENCSFSYNIGFIQNITNILDNGAWDCQPNEVSDDMYDFVGNNKSGLNLIPGGGKVEDSWVAEVGKTGLYITSSQNGSRISEGVGITINGFSNNGGGRMTPSMTVKSKGLGSLRFVKDID